MNFTSIMCYVNQTIHYIQCKVFFALLKINMFLNANSFIIKIAALCEIKSGIFHHAPRSPKRNHCFILHSTVTQKLHSNTQGIWVNTFSTIQTLFGIIKGGNICLLAYADNLTFHIGNNSKFGI